METITGISTQALSTETTMEEIEAVTMVAKVDMEVMDKTKAMDMTHMSRTTIQGIKFKDGWIMVDMVKATEDMTAKTEDNIIHPSRTMDLT
jgi:hypothetical protein